MGSVYAEAIEEACRRVALWHRTLRPFGTRFNDGQVVGFRYPALVSERDCVVHFARFLAEAGVPWDAMHHEVSESRWLYERPDVATPHRKWRVDLALLDDETFAGTTLPVRRGEPFFDTFFEFKFLDDSWKEPGARAWGAPAKGRRAVQADIDKVAAYLHEGLCANAYVVVFEQCDWEFAPGFAVSEEQRTGCKVRFIRSYAEPCPTCGALAAKPVVWGMPGPELAELEGYGRVVLGGCLVNGNGRDPDWQCASCAHRWVDGRDSFLSLSNL